MLRNQFRAQATNRLYKSCAKHLTRHGHESTTPAHSIHCSPHSFAPPQHSCWKALADAGTKVRETDCCRAHMPKSLATLAAAQRFQSTAHFRERNRLTTATQEPRGLGPKPRRSGSESFSSSSAEPSRTHDEASMRPRRHQTGFPTGKRSRTLVFCDLGVHIPQGVDKVGRPGMARAESRRPCKKLEPKKARREPRSTQIPSC